MRTHVHMGLLSLLTFFSSLFMTVSTFAQSPVILFQKTVGGSNNDILSDIQPTADGGSIAVGYSMSGISGDKTEALIPSTTSSTTDIWVVKLDATGLIQWQKNLGGDSYDFGESIKQTVDGGYIIGATSQSNISGDKTENSFGSQDYWIIKLDGTGAIQWQKTIGGDKLEKAKDIQVTNDGGYIVGGYSNSSISGNKTDNTNGLDDYWVVKLDDLGTIQWQKSIGSDGYDNLNELKQTADGGYILGGFTYEGYYPNSNFPRYGAHDFYVVKIDAVGTVEWQKVYGGSYDDYIESLQQTTDGGYILGGYSTSNISGMKTENSNGGSNGDYWLVKIDAIGTVQWQNDIGGSSLEYMTSVKQTQDGGYVLGGYSYSSISGDKTENSNGNGDYWVVKTNSRGSIQWQKTIGGSGTEFLTSLQQLADGSYLIGGYSASNISGDKTDNSQGGNDFWIVKLSDPGVTNTPSVSDVYYCPNGAAVPLTAIGQDLLWYTTATGGVGSTIAPTPNTNTLGFSTYYVSQTINSIESPRVAISSVVKSPPSVTITGLGTMCAGTSQNIMAYAGTAFVWSDGVTTSQRTIAPTSTTTYSVTITGVNGCTNSGSRTFYVSAPPVASISGASSLCNGTSATLTASPGSNDLYYGYRWSTGQTTASITVAPNSTKTYSVTITMGSCTSVAYKTMTVTGVAPSAMSIVGLNTSYLKTAAAVTLVGSPTGGTFRVDNIQRTTFNPAILSVGNHSVTYTITQGMCNSVITRIVSVTNPTTTNLQAAAQLAFNGVVDNKKVRLEWYNNTGYKNDYFVIQKWDNKGEFVDIETINAQQMDNDSELRHFIAFDSKPNEGDNQYRIKVVFKDGLSMLSELKTVQYKEMSAIFMFPNPATDFIEINLDSYVGKPVNVNVYNPFGQNVMHQEWEEVRTPYLRIDLTNYPSGSYVLRMSNRGKKDTVLKFIVNK